MINLQRYCNIIYKKIIALTNNNHQIKISEKEIIFISTNYPTDLTDEQRALIKHYFPYGNKSEWHKRSLVNAVLYLIKTGCQWRMLPNDFPPYSTVHSFYRRAKHSGLWKHIMHDLVKLTRVNDGRNESPSYGIIDSQSVKTTSASEERGIDGGKKIKGRKRHIVVDIMGNILAVCVHAANIHDTKSGIIPAKQAYALYPTLESFCGDDGYRKSFEENVSSTLGLEVDISKRIKPTFEILPKRWVVERTFSWLNHSRRLSKDYEITTSSEEAIIMISHIHTLLKRATLS